MSSDEKKYTAQDMAQAVLKKAHEMLVAHNEKLEKCGDMIEAKAEDHTIEQVDEKSSDDREKNSLKKFMAKKEGKRIKDGTPENLKEITKEKEYKGNC